MSLRDLIRGAEVSPSIYAADFLRLGAQLNALLDAGAFFFHFDVGDGSFIEDITIGPIVLRAVAPLLHERHALVSCHLMVDEPERQLHRMNAAGADGVCFHLESRVDPARAIAHAHELGLLVGVAFNPETPIERAATVGERADYLLCMSIHPGLSGQRFLPEAYDRIAKLRRLLPRAIIAVDGGVHDGNVAEVRRAGADVVIAGSAIFWGGDPGRAYRALRAQLLGEPSGAWHDDRNS
jgi:ribulose-phosphate 3-epimerase